MAQGTKKQRRKLATLDQSASCGMGCSCDVILLTADIIDLLFEQLACQNVLQLWYVITTRQIKIPITVQ